MYCESAPLRTGIVLQASHEPSCKSGSHVRRSAVPPSHALGADDYPRAGGGQQLALVRDTKTSLRLTLLTALSPSHFVDLSMSDTKHQNDRDEDHTFDDVVLSGHYFDADVLVGSCAQ